MPADDVSDLRDVFDAIDRLCETMKTSYEEPPPEPRPELVVRSVEILTAEDWDALSCETDSTVADERRECADSSSAFVSAEDISVRTETNVPWEESQVSLSGSETGQREGWSEPAASPPSPEVYYPAVERALQGHVAAMRERFESMTRAATPRPEPASPSLDVTPSPDRLDKE